MKDLEAKRKVIERIIQEIDDLAFWLQQSPFMTDEMGIMAEMSLSRLQAFESAVVIKLRELAEAKIVENITKRAKAKETTDAKRKAIEDSLSKPKATKPSARNRKAGRRNCIK